MRKSFLLLWVVTAGLLLFSWAYLPSLSRYHDLKVRLEEMDRQIRDLETKIKDIREERNLLKGDVKYLEKVIRDELGLVKPGEIVYKFVTEKAPSVEVQMAEDGEPRVAENTQPSQAWEPQTVPEIAPEPEALPAAEAPKPVPAQPSAPAEPVYPRQETR